MVRKRVDVICRYLDNNNDRSLMTGYLQNGNYKVSVYDYFKRIKNDNTGKMSTFGSNKVILFAFCEYISKAIRTNVNYGLLSESSMPEDQNMVEMELKNEIKTIVGLKKIVIDNFKILKGEKNDILSLIDELMADRVYNLAAWRVKVLSSTYTSMVNSVVKSKERFLEDLEKCSSNGKKVSFVNFLENNKDIFNLKNKKEKAIYDMFVSLKELNIELLDNLKNSNSVSCELVTKDMVVMISDIKQLNHISERINDTLNKFSTLFGHKCCLHDKKTIERNIKNGELLDEFIKDKAKGAFFQKDNQDLIKRCNDLMSYAKTIVEKPKFNIIEPDVMELTSKVLIKRLEGEEIQNIKQYILDDLKNMDIDKIDIDNVIFIEAKNLNEAHNNKTEFFAENSDDIFDMFSNIVQKIRDKDNSNDKMVEQSQTLEKKASFIQKSVEWFCGKATNN